MTEKSLIKQYFLKFSRLIGFPISHHPRFFVFIYLLGAICIFYEADRVYLPFFIKLFFELFFDLYIITGLICLFPQKTGNVIAWIVAIFLYATAIADLFCFVRIHSMLSPSIMRLIAETNSGEASEFLTTYVTPDIIGSPVGAVFLLFLVHLITSILSQRQSLPTLNAPYLFILRTIIFLLLVIGVLSATKNKYYLWQTWGKNSVGQIEKFFGDNFFAARAQYLPVYRLAFSIHTNQLAARQARHLLDITDQIAIDSCTFTSPNIVLIIGESYNKHHSQLYGYPLPTTPQQVHRLKEGQLVVFQDAVTPFNITSDVLKNAFSLNDLSQNEDWSDKPLFTQLFKKAGYHTCFISNFFVMKEQKDFADFSGGMFLNDAALSATQFDCRNTSTHTYDESLLDDYHKLKEQNTDHNLIIFTLTGQHVDYRDRYPASWHYFKPTDYQRPDLSTEELRIVTEYDNATRYNDDIVERIITLFKDSSAIVIYLPDHGEEVYDEVKTFGRQHDTQIPPAMAKNEFQVPFWIWMTDSYRKQQSDIVRMVEAASLHPFFSDDLSHMMLFLGGIHCQEYRDTLNILSPQYTKNRLRLLRGHTDYDKIIQRK